MDAQRASYSDWRTKNDALIQRIKELETGIEQVQRSIGEKHEEFGRLELEEHNLEQRQLLYAAYDDVFERLLEYQQPLNLTETSQPPNDQSRQRRRDVFEQLMTSTSLVCRKIERLCTSPPSMPITTADGDTTTRIDATISPTKSRLLEQDIQHLLETQSSKSFLDSIATLLQRENNIPAMNENTLNRSPATDPTFQEKLEGIRQQQKDRLKHVLDLEQEALDWKLRVRSLETQLQEKTQACYKDPQIQAAFVTCVLAKAECAEESRRLGSFEEYLANVKQISSVLEERHGNLDQIQKETEEAINEMSSQRKAISTIKSVNANGLPQVLGQKQQTLDLMKSIHLIHDQLGNVAMDTLLNTPSTPSSERSMKRSALESVEPSLDTLSNALGSSTLLKSPDKILQNLKSLLERLQLVSSNKQSTVCHELEALALAWADELEEKGIALPEGNLEQDAVDTVVGSVNALKEHVENDWSAFVKQQQDETLANLDRLDDSKEELDDIRLLLNERDIIAKGNLGDDYTAQDRNLEEWFQLLDQMKIS